LIGIINGSKDRLGSCGVYLEVGSFAADRMGTLCPIGVIYDHDREKPVSFSRSRAKRASRLFIPVGRLATIQSTGLAA